MPQLGQSGSVATSSSNSRGSPSGMPTVVPLASAWDAHRCSRDGHRPLAESIAAAGHGSVRGRHFPTPRPGEPQRVLVVDARQRRLPGDDAIPRSCADLRADATTDPPGGAVRLVALREHGVAQRVSDRRAQFTGRRVLPTRRRALADRHRDPRLHRRSPPPPRFESLRLVGAACARPSWLLRSAPVGRP